MNETAEEKQRFRIMKKVVDYHKLCSGNEKKGRLTDDEIEFFLHGLSDDELKLFQKMLKGRDGGEKQ